MIASSVLFSLPTALPLAMPIRGVVKSWLAAAQPAFPALFTSLPPFFPTFRSDAMALSGGSRRKQMASRLAVGPRAESKFLGFFWPMRFPIDKPALPIFHQVNFSGFRLCLTRSAALVAFAIGFCPPLYAQDLPPAPAVDDKNLIVVTRKVTPFVIETNGRLTGYSIELWERIVREAKLPFDPETGYKTVENVVQMLDELRAGKADAGVAAVSITSEREKTIDFSYPFKESGLQILTKDQSGSTFRKIVRNVFKGDIIWLLMGLIVVLLLNSHIIWFLERKKNAESFPDGYIAGIWEAIWWSICTIITGGCENKAPLGVAGRLTAVIWMLAGAGLFTYITATITSAMTVDTLNSDIRSVADLKMQKWPVGTVAGSTAQTFLERQGLTAQGFSDVGVAGAALAEGKVKAVVYDSPMLHYYAKSNPDKRLGVVGDLFEKQSYGIGLSQGCPQRESITQAILTLREQGVIDELEIKYFGIGTRATAVP